MFTILKTEQVIVNERTLTVQEKKNLTDAYASGLSYDRASRMYDIPEYLVNQSYEKKRIINEKVLEIMRGQCVKEVTEETIYYPVPTTKTALTNLAFTFFPDCAKESFAYNIDMIIKWCDGKGNATWTDFVNCLKN